MFHVNEAMDGKGILTIKDGKATIHIAMPSKSIVTLYPGLINKAKDDVANQIPAVEEEVTYSDGMKETVNAFDVPVPYFDKEFDLALIGTKGKWYDHKVYVSNPVPYEASGANGSKDKGANNKSDELSVKVTLEGGTGKATIDSPTTVKKDKDGEMIMTVTWSSKNYDYMIVDGEKYLPVNTEGNSVFEIPIKSTNGTIDVIADTIAMSKPHEIEYKITIKE